jgi:hypothetical protein
MAVTRWLWNERECVDVTRPHGAEVPVVQCGDRREAKPFSDGDQTRVKTAERMIAVSLGELSDTVPIIGGEALDDELSG